MHVAVLVATLEMGGVERVTVNLVNELVCRGHSVDLVCCSFVGEFRNLLDPRVAVHNLNCRRRTLVFKLFLFFGQHHVDVVYSSVSFFFVWFVKILRKQKFLSFVPIHGFGFVDSLAPVREGVSYFLEAVALKHADRILSISSAVSASVHEWAGVDYSRISLFYNPVFSAKDEIPDSDHPFWKLDVPIIVSAGRLAENKRFVDLLDAFSLVLRKRDARLLILGDGPEINLLKLHARDLKLENKVCFQGYVPNPMSYFRHCSVFVLPSAREPFGLVAVEALRAGIPVVATDCGGPCDIIDSPLVGELVAPLCPAAMSQAILRQLDRAPEDFRIACIKRSCNFTTERFVDNFENLYLALRR